MWLDQRASMCKRVDLLFYSFPSELIGTKVLTPYLTITDLSRLDVAVCSRAIRAYLEEAFRLVQISCSFRLEDDSMVAWIKRRGIQGSQISVTMDVSPTNLSYILRRFQGMSRVNLTGYDSLTDSHLIELSQSCKNVNAVNLTYCSDVTNDGLRELTTTCQKIEELVLWGCYNINNDGVQLISENCPRIKHLNLRCCKKITDEALKYIASGIHDLRHVNFTYCRNITDYGIEQLVRAHPNLQYLTAAYCGSITDDSLHALAKFCMGVEFIDVTGCHVTDRGLEAIAKNCKNLKYLNVGSCADVSDVGVSIILNSCIGMVALACEGCPKIKETKWEEMFPDATSAIRKPISY